MAPREGKSEKSGKTYSNTNGGKPWKGDEKGAGKRGDRGSKGPKGDSNKGGKGKERDDDDTFDDIDNIRRQKGKGRSKGDKSKQDGTSEDSWMFKERGGEERSKLSSSAPDFTPTGNFPCGSYGDGVAQFWDYQVLSQPSLPPLWKEFADEDSTPYYYNSKTGLTQWERPPELDPPKMPLHDGIVGSMHSEKSREAGVGHRRDGGLRDANLRDNDRDDHRKGDSGDRAGIRDGGQRRGDVVRGKRRGKPDDGGKKEGSEFGPPGCNLFVFHLPDDWTDDDLNEYFAPHGNVVSAKVMKELGTGRSRGFGFVSYEDRVSAATAIKKMQGYKILGKRLKVEFKKGEQEGSKSETEEKGDTAEDEESGAAKKAYPDDERLIGYLRAISAKNVVQSLKESEGGMRCDDSAELSEQLDGEGESVSA